MLRTILDRTRFSGGLLLLVALTAQLPVASTLAGQDRVLPIELPEPWGEYGVGVRTLVVVDSTRTATSEAGRTVPRPILVRIWYPAATGSTAVPRPYMHPDVAEAWRSTLPAASGFEAGVVTHGVDDAPLAAERERWPVLLFSHGRSYPVENYQILLEQLASRGWLIVAISHPGEEARTRLPDGTSFAFSGPEWETPEARGRVLMGVVDELVLDAKRVLDTLERIDADAGDAWAGRLALAAGVGYLGHSLGGAAAVWTQERDERVRAAMSWEGQVYRDVDRPLVAAGPILYVVGGANRGELAGRQFRGSGPGRPVYEVILRGAWHISVGDILYIYRRYAPRDWLGRHRREITAARANQITVDLAHEFFGRYLLGGDLDLLRPDGEDEAFRDQGYPEVELRLNTGGNGFWTAGRGSSR